MPGTFKGMWLTSGQAENSINQFSDDPQLPDGNSIIVEFSLDAFLLCVCLGHMGHIRIAVEWQPDRADLAPLV